MANNETEIAAVAGSVVIQHREPVRRWTMTPDEARAIAAALERMAAAAGAQQS
jgi:hypothetical protein